MDGIIFMKLEMTNFQAVAENLVPEGEVCDLPPSTFSTPTETETEIAALIQKAEAAPIAEIERLIAELQKARDHLHLEAERIEREMVQYANLAQTASVTTKIIFDAVSQWHPARSQQQSTASEIKATSTEDKSDHHSQWDTSELGDEPRAFPGVGRPY
jgi:hypothetical protein